MTAIAQSVNSASVQPRAKSAKTKRRPIIIQLSRKLRLIIQPGLKKRISSLLSRLLGIAPLLLAGAVWNSAWAQTLPSGGVVASGSATIATSGNNMTINQASNSAILNWQSFSIGAGNSVRFNQPSSSSVALNRVLGNSPSEIFGSLSANGRVFLVNQNGILMGRGAQIDTGAFVGSTLNIKDSDFLSGKYVFDRANNTGGVAGSIINLGSINTPSGYAVLIAPQVTNNGLIAANVRSSAGGAANGSTAGTVAIAAGDKVSLDMVGDGLISVKVDQAALNAAVVNTGTIEANGGSVLIKASSANALLDTVINSAGVIRANSISAQNGRIILDGGERGVTSVSGEVSATGAAPGQTGGAISVLGDKVGLMAGAKLDASGDAGGGTVLVGGNWQGNGAERNASRTIVFEGASIDASATGNGNGGTVAVWADGRTDMQGTILARGGAQGGDGGKVETSGKQALNLQGTVDISAAKGQGGQWLLDPNDITIQNNDIFLATTAPTYQDNAGANSAQVSATNLNAALTGGATITIQTSNAGTASGGTGKITVNSAIAAAGAATLNLVANGGITVGNTITGSGAALNLGLYAGSTGTPATIATAGGQAGVINVSQAISTTGGKITMVTGSGSDLTLNSTLTSGGGDITLKTPGRLAINDVMNAGAGTIRLNTNALTTVSTITTSGGLGINNATGSLQLIGNNNVGGTVSIANAGGAVTFKSTSATGFTVGTVAADGTLFAAGNGVSSGSNIALAATTGGITLNQGITSAGNIVLLDATSVTGTGAISAGTLGVNATAGAINMTGASLVTGTVALKATGDIAFTNGANAELGQASTFSGTLFNGANPVNGVSTTAGNTITLNQNTGTLSQNTTVANSLITAGATGKLLLGGAGNFALNNATNLVGTIAGTATGNKKYVNSAALSVDTVGAASGLTGGAGDVSLRAVTGNLSLAQAINAGTGTVRLQADAGAVNEAGGVITAGHLGVRAGTSIALGGTNAIAAGGSFAARAGNGNLNFINANGVKVDGLTADAGFFTATDGLSAAGNNVTLSAANGTFTQTAAKNITATGLELNGNAAYTLGSTGNAITNIAATTGAGAIGFVNSAGLTVGTVGATNGITRTGDVTLSAANGTLSINQALNAGSGTVRLIGGGLLDQTAAITAANLGVNAAGTILLTQNNAISGNVAIRNTNGGGSTAFFNNGAITLDTVAADGAGYFTATNGVDTNGNVTIGANGAFTLTQGITTAGSRTVRLQGSSVGGAGVITAATLGVRATAGAINLTGANSVSGNVAMSSTGAAKFSNSNGFTLGQLTQDGTLFGANTTGITTSSSDISLKAGGALAINQAIDTGAGFTNVRIEATGAVTQTAAITSRNLGVRGTSIDLSGATNLQSNGAVALNASAGNAVYKSGAAYDVGSVTADGSLFTATNGFNASGNVTLDTVTGNVTQSNAITASGLELKGGVAFTLGHASNNIATLAAAATGGVIKYSDSDGFAVGTVNSVGLVNTNNVSLRTATGNLTVTGPITATANTVRLQADAGSVTGTGVISATNLGVRAATGISLSAANAVSGNLAMSNATSGNIAYRNANSVAVNSVAADGTFFSANTAGASASGQFIDLTLDAGTLTQGGATESLQSSGLVLRGNGTYALDNTSNSVGTIAATTGTGSIQLRHGPALTVGTVNGVSGMTRTNDVSLKALTGGITVNGPITATANAVRLETLATIGGTVTGAGVITATNLGVRAIKGISLTGANAVSSNVALRNSSDGNISFRNANSLVMGQVAADGVYFGVTNGLSAAGQNIALTVDAGTATQTATAAESLIAASGLELKGAGAFTLTNTSNDVANIAATSAGAGDGAIRYIDANQFTVNTIGATVGMVRTGDIMLRAASANVQVTEQINTGAANKVRLEATTGNVAGLGAITTADLGVRTPTGQIALGGSNAVSTSVALEAQSSVSFKNTSSVQLNNAATDGTVFQGAVSGASSTGGGNITLEQTSGTVTQAATRLISTTGGLELQGAGNFTLDQANDVATIAGNTTGTVKYRDTNALSVGTVTTAGFTAVPNLFLRSGGNLTINQRIAGDGTVRLQADGTSTVTQAAAGSITMTDIAVNAGSIDLTAATAAGGNTGGAGLALAANDAAGTGIKFKTQSALFANAGAAVETGFFTGIAGITTAGNKNITLVSTGGASQINQAVNAGTGTVRILAANGLTQNATGIITAGNLGAEATGTGAIDLSAANNALAGAGNFAAKTANGAIKFNNANAITLGTVAADGALTNALTGVVAGTNGDVTLSSTGAIAVSQAVNAGTGTVRLQSGAAITQTAAITAAHLGARGTAGVTLTNTANAITGNVALNSTTGASKFLNNGAFTVGAITADGAFTAATGATTTNQDITLNTAAGNLTINEAVNAGTGTVRIQSAGTVTQAAAGVITAANLGVRGAALDLTTATNAVSTDAALNASTLSGVVKFNNGAAFNVGSVTADGTLFTATTGIATNNGDVTLNGAGAVAVNQAVNAGTGTVRLQSTGAVTQAAAGVITAANLGARGASVDLTTATNAITTDVALNASTAAAAAKFKNGAAFNVGSVTADGTLFTATTGIATNNGDVTLNGAGAVAVNQAVNAGTGTVRLQSTGAVTQAAAGVITAANLGARGASVDLTTATNAITTDAALNASTAAAAAKFKNGAAFNVGSVSADGTLFTATTGIATNNGDVTLSGAGALAVNQAVNAGTGTVRLQSTGAVTQAAAGVITTTHLGARGTGVDLTTATGGNAIGGNVAFNSSAGASKLLSNTGFTVQSIGADSGFTGTNGITATNQDVTLSTSAGNITINGLINAGTGTVRLQSAGTVSQTVTAAITAANLGARGTSVDLSTAANAVSTNVALNARAGDAKYKSANAFAVGSVAADGALFTLTDGIFATGNVTLDSAGAATQAAGKNITATGLELKGAGPFTLTNAGNNVATLAGATTGAVSYTDTDAVAVGTVNSVGLNAGGNAVTITTPGALSINQAVSGSDVALTGTTGINAAANITATGTLGLTTTNSAITQTAGTITATGATTVAAGSGNVTLAQTTNDFGNLAVTGGAITIKDTNALTLTTVASGTNQAVDIESVNGTLTTSAINTGTANLTLRAGAALTTGGALTGNNLALTGATGINLGHNVTSTGTLGLTTTNSAVNQTAGAVVATGVTTLATGTGSTALNQAANNFSTVTGTTGALTLTDANALVLGALTANGAVTLTAAGNVTQSGALTQAGAGNAVSVTATTGVIKLTNAANDVQGTVNLAAAAGGAAFTNNNAAGIKAGNITAATTANTAETTDIANFTASDAALKGAVVLRALQGNIERSGVTKIIGDVAVVVAANRIGGALTTDALLGLAIEGAGGASMPRVFVSAAPTQTASFFGPTAVPTMRPAQPAFTRPLGVYYNGTLVSLDPVVPASGSTPGGDAQNNAQQQGDENARRESNGGNNNNQRLNEFTPPPGNDGGGGGGGNNPFSSSNEPITVPSCAPGAARPAGAGQC